jgi:membrane associated rhomboid family serine protease
MPNVQGFSTLRARSYVFRLPLFTRAMILIIVLLWLAGIQSVWDLRQWGSLIPDQISITTGESVYKRRNGQTSDASIRSDDQKLEWSWLTRIDVAAYRINTFPLIHLNFFHMLFNVIALAPLLERFESEYGTLTSLAMFFGRKRKIILRTREMQALGKG